MPSPKMQAILDRIEKADTVQKQLLMDYQSLFNSPKGEGILNDIKERFGWLEASTEPGMKMDDVTPHLREGAKEIIRWIEFCRLCNVNQPTN